MSIAMLIVLTLLFRTRWPALGLFVTLWWTLQSLYNLIDAIPKRHSIFKNIQVEEEHSDLTLKSMSVTRWLCCWQAVKAVIEKMPRIIRALLSLSSDCDVKTYTDSNNSLNAICDFKFVFDKENLITLLV